jgi:hypothetical protein
VCVAPPPPPPPPVVPAVGRVLPPLRRPRALHLNKRSEIVNQKSQVGEGAELRSVYRGMPSRLNSEQIVARGGSKSVSYLRRPPPAPPSQPPPRRRAAAPSPGMERLRLFSQHRSHAAWRFLNRQARSSLAQREPAWSTGGDRPSGTDMKRVAAAPTTGCYRNPDTGSSRTHTHEHRSQCQEGATAGLGRKGGPVQRRR